jgi:hypothetical protein
MINYPFNDYSRILIKAININIEHPYSERFFNHLMSDFTNNVKKKKHIFGLIEIDTKIVTNNELYSDSWTPESFMYICPIFLRGNGKFVDFSVSRKYEVRSDLTLHLHFESGNIFDIYAVSIQKDRYNGNITGDFRKYVNSILLKIQRQEKIESLYNC